MRTCHAGAQRKPTINTAVKPVRTRDPKKLTSRASATPKFVRLRSEGQQLLHRSALLTAGWPATSFRSSACGLDGPNESAHKLTIHLRRNGVHVQALCGEKLACILCPINPSGLNVNLLEARCRKFSRIFLIAERSCHAPDPQKLALTDYLGDCAAGILPRCDPDECNEYR